MNLKRIDELSYMSIVEREIIGEFSHFSNWEERYEHIINIGKSLTKMEERSEDKLIGGCQSKVWIGAYLRNGNIILRADSDAILPSGIAALMSRVYSDKYPKEIIPAKINFIYHIGLNELISPIRTNGMFSMINKIKFYAKILQKIWP
ncbi:MAG TPA: SufE family protein [Blattabacteriaceae bacterium]